MTLCTIGYEGVDIDEFVSALTENGVETVVDVREYPLSRKKGFSKTALNNALNSAGIEYIHIAALGCPKVVRHQYRADGDWARYTVGFLEHLEQQHKSVVSLADLAQTTKCALVCFEADHNFCHRSMVASAVCDYVAMSVEHINAQMFKRDAVDAHYLFA